MYEFAVIIGRFQPFHAGHKALVEEALKIADNLIIFIGSRNVNRSFDNPWTVEERIDMIKRSLDNASLDRVILAGVNDTQNDPEAWVKNVVENVRNLSGGSQIIVLVGHRKDDSSYYLDLFPMWAYREIPSYGGGISGADIRRQYFKDQSSFKEVVPPEVAAYMEKFSTTSFFKEIQVLVP